MSQDKVRTLTIDALQRIRYYGWDRDVYDAEFYEQVRAETGFRRVEDIPKLSIEDGREVAEGRKTCPLCGWNPHPDTVVYRKIALLHRGEATGLELNLFVTCPCRFYQLIWERWSGRLSMVGERYQDIRLSKLQPDLRVQLPLSAQAKIIQHLKTHPHDCYLFCGETGKGKTTYQTALFAYALFDWAEWVYANPKGVIEGVWRINTATLLKQHMDWNRRLESINRGDHGSEERSGPALPMVRSEDIRAVKKRGFRPRLFLDEIDKSTLTQPQKVVLFDLIDTIYECNGQLVVCANSSLLDLEAILGPRMGGPVIRRIVSAEDTLQGVATGGTIFDFFDPAWADALEGSVTEVPDSPTLVEQSEPISTEKEPTSSSTHSLPDQLAAETNAPILRMAQRPPKAKAVTTAGGIVMSGVDAATGTRKFGAPLKQTP